MQNLSSSLTTVFYACAMLVSTSTSYAETKPAQSLDELLGTLKSEQAHQTQENQGRIKYFKQKQAEQTTLLNSATQSRDAAIKKSEQLEQTFNDNETKLTAMNTQLDKRMGSLKELFGVLQQVTADTKSKFDNSPVSAQIPDREKSLNTLLAKLAKGNELATIEEIEGLWYEMQREMTANGQVTRFERKIIDANGKPATQEVMRVGAFNLISNGQYLEYLPTTGTVAELIRQPIGRYLDTAEDLQESENELTTFALDPTGGSILGLLVQAPTLLERVEQGGVVGYVILAVGLVGLLLSLERLYYLNIVANKVNKQLKKKKANKNNPLGRVMKVQDKYPEASIDTLELKLSEAIMREVPSLTKYLTFIKIISVVAPLLGLLGTVTGMINTFQAITLFGTGDPKLMAGGISQALVTTVLGLVVAIPTVLLSTMLNTRSRYIISVLQEECAGVLAARSERFLKRKSEKVKQGDKKPKQSSELISSQPS